MTKATTGTSAKKAAPDAVQKALAAIQSAISKPATSSVKKVAAVKKPAVAKKTATAKSAADTPSKKQATAVKTNGGTRKKLNITPEQRYCMVAEAAYYRAEKRGFVGGDTSHDWVEAEAEISRLIGG